MIVTRIKYKYAVVKIDVNKLERFRPIEVRLPANIKRVTGVHVTASRK